MSKPSALTGLRVLDFSKVLAAPLCAQYMGDMGADVVKMEAAEQVTTRAAFPPYAAAAMTPTAPCS